MRSKTQSEKNHEVFEKEDKQSTEAFNNMPFEYRKIACDHTIFDHVLHLKQARAKAVRAHKVLLKDFDDHIKNIERSIADNARTRKNDEPQVN